nr:MAG TPA: hypothetical protein [Caudoviricetes sp.]
MYDTVERISHALALVTSCILLFPEIWPQNRRRFGA